MFSETVSPGATPAKICFKLPATHTGTVGVTVAVVDKVEPSWLITHASYATPFNVTKGKEQQGCILWNGLDENFWPVPPGSYGLKGIFTNVSQWAVDGKYHALIPEVTGSIGPYCYPWACVTYIFPYAILCGSGWIRTLAQYSNPRDRLCIHKGSGWIRTLAQYSNPRDRLHV